MTTKKKPAKKPAKKVQLKNLKPKKKKLAMIKSAPPSLACA
jgi:hypothetical protein